RRAEGRDGAEAAGGVAPVLGRADLAGAVPAGDRTHAPDPRPPRTQGLAARRGSCVRPHRDRDRVEPSGAARMACCVEASRDRRAAGHRGAAAGGSRPPHRSAEPSDRPGCATVPPRGPLWGQILILSQANFYSPVVANELTGKDSPAERT